MALTTTTTLTPLARVVATCILRYQFDPIQRSNRRAAIFFAQQNSMTMIIPNNSLSRRPSIRVKRYGHANNDRSKPDGQGRLRF
jgi:RAB protein geranylgeranyltransferase component A